MPLILRTVEDCVWTWKALQLERPNSEDKPTAKVTSGITRTSAYRAHRLNFPYSIMIDSRDVTVLEL